MKTLTLAAGRGAGRLLRGKLLNLGQLSPVGLMRRLRALAIAAVNAKFAAGGDKWRS